MLSLNAANENDETDDDEDDDDGDDGDDEEGGGHVNMATLNTLQSATKMMLIIANDTFMHRGDCSKSINDSTVDVS